MISSIDPVSLFSKPLHDSLYFSMHLRDVLNVMHSYMHAQFAALIAFFGNFMTYLMTDSCAVSCALISDVAIRVCSVITVTADRTGKIVLLTYSLTASRCSAEAHLAGLSFPRSFDSRLALRLSCSARLKSLVGCGCKKKHWFRVLKKAFLVDKKGCLSHVRDL